VRGRRFVELYVKDNRLTKGLAAASQKLMAFGAGLTSLGTKLAGIGTALTTPFVLAAKSFADMGSELVDMSQRTGVSAEALSELGYAAEQSGADLETLEGGLRKMQKFVVGAAGGSKEARDALGKLGLSVADFKALAPEDQFKLIADRLAGIANPTQRAALAMEVFGKSGTKLLPLFADGAQGIEALQQKARDLGLTISNEDAAAAEEFGDTLDTLWKVIKRAAFVVGSALAPALKDLAEWLTRAAKYVIDWINQNRELIVTVFKVAAAVAAAGIALIGIGAAVSFIGSAIGGAVALISGIGTVLGVLLNPITLVIAALGGLVAYLLYTSEAGAKALDWLGERFGGLRDTALAAWEGISDALAAGDLGLAAKIAWLALKMEFQKGILWLEEKWIDFKNFFIDTFYKAVYGLASFLNDAWAGIQVAWVETVAFLGNTWTNFISVLQKGWNRFSGFFQKVWAKVKSVFTGGDADAEIAQINEQVAAEDNAINSRRDAAINDRETERQRRRKAIEADRAGVEGELGRMQEAERAEREAKKQAALKETGDALAEAKQEFDDALAEAKRKREEADAAKSPDRMKKPDFPELDEVADTARAKVDVQGTFNAMGVRGFGADSLNERTAKAAEQTAANTKRLVQEAQNGGLVFA
jgi:hypothetical protein